MIASPPTVSVPLFTPPRRRACPPARIAAASADLLVMSRPTRVSNLARPGSVHRPVGCGDERAKNRPSARGQPASGDCRTAPEQAGVLRELVERLGPAARHDRPG